MLKPKTEKWCVIQKYCPNKIYKTKIAVGKKYQKEIINSIYIYNRHKYIKCLH